jgi:predicted porin
LEKIEMKKTLVAIAALSAISAFAQSSVNLSGTVDVRLGIGNGSISNNIGLLNNGIASSKFQLTGVEDLGGGLKAGFHLEAGFSPDDGTGSGTNVNNQGVGGFNPATGANGGVRPGSQGFTFNRRSTLSVMGGFGEVRLGRDYTPHFWNHTYYDPFGTNGVGNSMAASGSAGGAGKSSGAGGVTVVRASNSIGYFTPNFGGFSGQIQTYFGENGSNSAAGSDTGSGSSLRVGYVQGPINVGLAWGKTTTGISSDTTSTNLGGSYDLGIVKIMGAYLIDARTNQPDTRGWVFGVTAPVGPGSLKAAFSQTDGGSDNIARQFALGYEYALSKRSTVYATVATINNSKTDFSLNGSTTKVGEGSTGFDIGVKHSF